MVSLGKVAALVLVLLPVILAAQGTSRTSLAFYELGYLYSNGKGIDVDVVTELEKRLGFKFQTQVLARSRIWQDIESGNLAMTVSGVQTPERLAYAWFIPYLSQKNLAVLDSRKGISMAAEDFLDRPDLRFGVVTSFRHGLALDEFIQKLKMQARIEESPDSENLFVKLLAGRIQGFFAHPLVAAYYLKDLPPANPVMVVDWFKDEKGVTGGLVLSRKVLSEADYLRYRKVVEAMKADGTLERIFLRYVDPDMAKSMLDF